MSSDQPGTNRPPLLLLVNPVAGSGRGKTAGDRLGGALQAMALPFVRHDTNHAGHARVLAATQRPGQTVVLVGGDGTVHEVLNGLPVHDGHLGPLAVLPCGSGDDFASSLRLSKRPEDLAAALANAIPRPIDVALARYDGPAGPVCERFANSAALGFDGEVAAEARKPHRVRGRLLYALATFAVLRRNPRFLGTITVDEGPGTKAHSWQQELSFVATGNGHFLGGGLHLFRDGRLDDGRLDAVAVPAVPRRTILWLFGKLILGRHRGDPRLQVHQGRRIHIASDRPLEGALDGEGLQQRVRAITYEIAPERLRFVGARQP
ncbi:MAG: diacylglycerol kinase family protein [Planctomycetota bacterium]